MDFKFKMLSYKLIRMCLRNKENHLSNKEGIWREND